ncbi:hypothetical protein MRB53_008951 [Persea americana]|uniref:Uncharacterized protein n=1 Tax=Persea americana TaxID=3435 RepID=A0ACC2LMN7_PERAE|nr:hypothetical protein MRB53_008951 [Persea americana]
MMDSGGFHAAASSLRQTSTEPKIAPTVRRRNSGSDFGRTSPNPGKSIKNRTFFSGSSSGSTLFQMGGVITRCKPKQEHRDNLSLLRRAIADSKKELETNRQGRVLIGYLCANYRLAIDSFKFTMANLLFGKQLGGAIAIPSWTREPEAL